MKFYNGYYQILESQLKKYSTHTIDCVNLFTDNKRYDSSSYSLSQWDTLHRLFGFDEINDFMIHIENKEISI